MWTIVLLVVSNVFMTLAWNHLIGFAFIGLGGFFVFKQWSPA